MENKRAQMCSQPKPKLSSIKPQAQTGLQPRRKADHEKLKWKEHVEMEAAAAAAAWRQPHVSS